ncbi:MAG: glycosyltransferase [Candidatus Eisenbacteria bacterium]
MKILFLTSRLPYPPHRGDRVRTYNFLKRLSRDHEIHLLTFVESADETRHFAALEPYCRPEAVVLTRRASYVNMFTRSMSKLPFQVLYYRSPGMSRAVERRLRRHRFDLVYTHLFRMAPFAPEPDGALRVLDLTDCISAELAASIRHRPLPMRLPLKLEVGKIRRYETESAGRFHDVWTISESDREKILRMSPDAPVTVVPNGVDESLFEVSPARSAKVLGFLGNFGVPHNIDAARHLVLDIMPRILESVPDARLELIGQGHSPALRKLDGANGTTVVGPTESLGEALGRLTVFLSPLRFAAGVQNKILEAMASGLPVVTSSPGNRGLAAEPETEIVVRDGPEEFAAAAVSLLRDPVRAARVGEKGRVSVRRRFSWDRVAARVDDLLSSGPRER